VLTDRQVFLLVLLLNVDSALWNACAELTRGVEFEDKCRVRLLKSTGILQAIKGSQK
jgi:hypothetical protein